MGFSLIYTPVLHYDDINGRPLVGGKLYTYKSGTNTPAPTYRNKNGTELNENPIPLNERGECVCFLDDGLKYKFVLKDALDNTIWEQDNVSIPANEGGGGGGGGSYTAGAGIDITNNVISANFVPSAPKSAVSHNTFPAVDNGEYTITSEDLQGGFIYLRLADIRPADAVQAGIGCSFQVFLHGLRFYRQDPQTTVTVGNRFTCEFEWVLAEIADPSMWLNYDSIEDVELAWKSQEFSTYRSLAFACDDNGADWVNNAPHLSIYLPPELRSELQAGDTLEILGEIYVKPGKDRLSLV